MDGFEHTSAFTVATAQVVRAVFTHLQSSTPPALSTFTDPTA